MHKYTALLDRAGQQGLPERQGHLDPLEHPEPLPLLPLEVLLLGSLAAMPLSPTLERRKMPYLILSSHGACLEKMMYRMSLPR